MKLRQAPGRIGSAGARIAAAPKAVDAFYRSPEWRGLSSRLKRERGFRCEDAQHVGPRVCAERDLIGDHVVERRDGGADLDEANILIRCRACHNRKTAAERARRTGTG